MQQGNETPGGRAVAATAPGAAAFVVRSLHRHGRRSEIRPREIRKTGDEPALLSEHQVLLHLEDVPGVPRVLALESLDGQPVLRTSRLPGRPLDRVDLGAAGLLSVLLRALVTIVRLAGRGVSHNDLRAENWILADDGRLCLVDFDRATFAGPLVCLQRALLRVRRRDVVGLGDLVRGWTRDRLPPALLRRLRRAEPPATYPADGVDLRRLDRAWRRAALAPATSPGRPVGYYRFRIGGTELPGERDFAARWRLLRRAVDWQGRRVLELGCNLGLLSTLALRDEGAAAALAVDCDAAILDAAGEAAAAFGVAPTFARLDLDHSDNWEAQLAAWRPDLVLALSLVNWVRSPERLLRFLVACPLVLVEGHGSVRTERRRLLAAGFRDVERIMTTDRGRPLFRCIGG